MNTEFLNKLRYDLALNCALVDVLGMEKTAPDFRTSSAMLVAFERAYKDLCTMDVQNLKNLCVQITDFEKNKTDLLKTIK